MLVDLKLSGMNVVVVGGGRESYRKILKFLEEGSRITVYSRSFSAGFKRLKAEGKISLVKANVNDAKVFITRLEPKPHLLIAATDNRDFNAELASNAKAAGCMVYAIDNPSISDFTLPALARIGDVKVAVSTGGKSPAVARALRIRIERMVKPEDLLQIQLQHQIRGVLKRQIADQRARRRIIYSVFADKHIKELLKAGKMEEARLEAFKIIEGYTSNKG
ncbi:MAG: bifunctional precorrin-2 dehydrogenase/sirohydrochlorin ferrochelatase [Candidatus Bathyarchaeota archaeon]|nr:bifunctional precorrin-2 dehydrogenase/sirohydrochlorin ferrochelatase [Candidatus Bathyarchaeota archaeon]MCX8177206.1 bifunctional precorrin-2 dehydrogenase/sirohydrochlorin ferrochelatase [Candidatus Bathyarchaeota archaeon]MDW8193551.1 bifunctional precorrin-2 dehydrogenase/sirohydrochlorin ferrochelatase [Nitrososphaerota archaeon]